MHRHLFVVRVAKGPELLQRPAKVVQLDVRRKARLEASQPGPRPAA